MIGKELEVQAVIDVQMGDSQPVASQAVNSLEALGKALTKLEKR